MTKKKSKIFLLIITLFLVKISVQAQQKTYCNPVNIDYGYTPFEVFSKQGKHRTTADPVIINFKGKFFLFSTNQMGYWWSKDLLNWNFISRNFLLPRNQVLDNLCAPAVFVMKDEMYVIGSTQGPAFPIWKSKNPTTDDWTIAVDSFKVGAWDPAFFYDEEKDKLYLYWGSSNEFPLYGTEINTKTLQSEGFVKPLISLHDEDHGWERFGENNDNTFLQPFIEGAWMTKYQGKYYLQYSAPGTEFSGYADGVYVSSEPLDGFGYQSFNPFCYKPGGFAHGAGHGSTFQDNSGNFWHVSTIAVGVKNNFERRIGIWPTAFDKDGILFCNTAYGDYPTFLPTSAKESFVGWMLLNYQKPVQVSSTLGGFQSNFAVDEDIKTYWSAKSADKGEWFQSDLGEISTVNAVQVNFADQDVDCMGKTLGKSHKYQIFSSVDGIKWNLLIDKSKNEKDVPHDYIELEKSVETRFLKIVNIQMPSGKFTISGFRVFGNGKGIVPNEVENFVALRNDPNTFGERRNIWLKWQQNQDADGYLIYFGKSPEKLYGSIMVFGKNEYYFNGADRADTYYFQIEAFNNNGISKKSKILKCE